MIINSAPQNEAVLSNVGEIGEFRIRNSAKAFNILSSGLYANKIRAIVRELSCNAVDSHVAAGKADTPFDVHFPSQMEPWFSIRDYGTGLTHEQVTQIYTTYFESTKTESNEFIGALGLGSKSPFSYTDNFTVTAVRDGKRGVYSAFINAQGVPSIALMMTEETTDPAGVEVKFSVNDYWDFGKFRDEARHVYTYFKLRPVISGVSDFDFTDVEYDTKEIVPGVHSYSRSRYSKAVMGNIAYPIDVPNADKNLGNLANLLNCGLEMHFGIGELDFQASREGLSYIPQTIESIKRKLEAVNAQLAVHVKEEADKIANLWERALFLDKKRSNNLWSAAVEKYVVDSKFPLMQVRPNYGVSLNNITIKVEDLATRFNVAIRGFQKNRGASGVTSMNASNNYDRKNLDAQGHYITWSEWNIGVSDGATFVVNDLKVGATERAKYHFRNCGHNGTDPYTRTVYVLEPADKKVAMNVKAFLRAIKNPPASMIMNASTLMERERAVSTGGVAKNVTIMKLQERGTGGYYTSKEMVWRDAGKATDFDSNTTYYYLELSGFTVVSERTKDYSGKRLISDLVNTGLPELQFQVYGVRKGDIEFIKTQKNWVNAEDHIEKVLKNLTQTQINSMAMGLVDRSRLVYHNDTVIAGVTKAKSPYLKFVNQIRDAVRVGCDEDSVATLCKVFGTTIDLTTVRDQIVSQSTEMFARYPMLKDLSYRVDNAAVAEYINAIDLLKGLK
jgi:hypothetical protein